MTFPTLFHSEPAQFLALGRYEVARRAVAEARAVDDLIEVLGRNAAVHAYARQAKDRQMEIDAVEIRIRAERRLGELMALQKATVGMAKGTRGQLAGRDGSGGLSTNPPEAAAPTLAEAGVDKNLAHRARTYAAVPEEKFEKLLKDKREGESRHAVLDPDGHAAIGDAGSLTAGNSRPAQLVAALRRRIAALIEENGALKRRETMWRERALAAGWSERAA